MSYIITDDRHYKATAKSLRSKMQTDREYYPEDMAIAVDNIPSSADGTDNPITGIYFLNPNENGYPKKIKVSGFNLENKETAFPLVFNDKIFRCLETVEFLNCDFKYLQDGAFANCSKLTNITLSGNVTSIGNRVFYACSNLNSISIPNSVISIGDQAFRDCSNLKSITIPNSVTSIGNWAFQACSNLKSITIPNSVTSIGNSALERCPNLVEVAIAQGFNCNNLVLSASPLYTRETILQWLNALADRTGQTAYKLTIGKTNLAKLTEEDIAIATAKNWTLA